MKMIIGLGNPGKEYVNTRHNVGFMVLDAYLGDVKWSKKFQGLYFEKNINGEKYIFLKPQTYMNNSGQAVKSFMNYYNLDKSDILVIHDDLDLEIGSFKIKCNSSSGGHNGIKDIITCIASQDFARLKIGISKSNNSNTIDYVLGNFSKNESIILENNYSSYFDIIDNFSANNLTTLMNKYN